MRIDNPISTNAIITGSFTGSFKGDGSQLTGIEHPDLPAGVVSGSEQIVISDTTGYSTFNDAVTLNTAKISFDAASSSKLDGIEANATADQTAAEIKTAYESNADTNEFSDAEKSKLAGLEAGAEVNVVTSVASKTGDVSLVKGDVGLGNVDNTSDANKPISTATQTALDLKSPLASPTFTGTVTIPTPILSDDSTKAATTAYVTDKIQEVVAAAPAALDTLNELAAAIGDDANFASTVTTSLGEKLVKASNLSDLTDAAAARTNLGVDAAGTVNYTHPSHPGDDFSVDSGALTGATVISDIDINVTTDTLGHVTDANGTIATRTLTLADLGYTGATNATANVGDITSVGAGNGLTGGGTSGAVTLNVVAGNGLSVAADSISMSGTYTGNFTATGDISAYSDSRLKKDVKTIEGALDKTKELRGVEFTRIADDAKSIGVIAQELESVLPELVLTDDEGMKSVNYAQITGLLIEAVKELSAKVDELSK